MIPDRGWTCSTGVRGGLYFPCTFCKVVARALKHFKKDAHVCVIVCLLVYLSAGLTKQIFLKPGGRMGHGPRKYPFHFGISEIPPIQQISNVLSLCLTIQCLLTFYRFSRGKYMDVQDKKSTFSWLMSMSVGSLVQIQGKIQILNVVSFRNQECVCVFNI